MNDNAPEISINPIQDFQVRSNGENLKLFIAKSRIVENTPSNLNLATISVNDRDSGSNGEVSCELLKVEEAQMIFQSLDLRDVLFVNSVQSKDYKSNAYKQEMSPFILQKINRQSYLIRTNAKMDRENLTTISCAYNHWTANCDYLAIPKATIEENPSISIVLGKNLFIFLRFSWYKFIHFLVVFVVEIYSFEYIKGKGCLFSAI